MTGNGSPLLVFALEQESQGLFADYEVLYTGVGKVNAAYALTKRISVRRPGLVVNLGTAGSSSFKTGEIVYCTRFIQRDMDASPLGFEKWATPFSDCPATLEYGLSVPGVKAATCGTGDCFDIAHTCSHAYDLVDMEAYTLAYICWREQLPFICLKYISDGADEKASTDWEPALKKAAESLRSIFDAEINNALVDL